MTSASTTPDTLSLLFEVSALFHHHRVDDVLAQLIRLSAQATESMYGNILLLRGRRITNQYISDNTGAYKHPSNVAKILLDQGLAGWIARFRQVGLIEDTLTDQRWFQVGDDHYRSALGVPILYHDELLAIITLAHESARHFTPSHVELLQIIANQAAIAISNARLFEQLGANRRQMDSVIDVLPDALLIMDSVGRFIVINDAMRKLLGLNAESVIAGTRLSDLATYGTCFDQICREWLEHFEQLKVDGSLRFETHSALTERDFRVSISAWRTDSNAIAGYVIAMHDITSLRSLHRFKDEMLRMASHDLRSPLAMIIGYADVILLDLPESLPILHEHLDTIMRYATRMDNLLQDLLRIEKIRESPLELHELIHPKPLVEDVVQALAPHAAQKQIKFGAQVNLGFVDTFIMADGILIRQAMENLVTNALKYTPSGGSVAIIARFDFPERKFHFVVVDSGVGIPEDKLPYVFESFYRVKDANVQAIQGTGLGLSLVKSVIEKHNGKIWATSVVNQGSRFGFWLPLQLTSPETTS